MQSIKFSTGLLFPHDCVEVMRGMQPESVSMIFADPPFNLDKNYGNGFVDRRDDYQSWSEQWIRAAIRLLKPGGAFFLYCTPALGIQFAPILDNELTFRHWIAISMKSTFPRGKKLYPAHYTLLYFTKGDPGIFRRIHLPIPKCRHCDGEIPDYGGHRNKMHPDGVSLTDVWTDVSPVRHANRKLRPGVNELPEIIPERCIIMSTRPEGIILDPFCGTGSALAAAHKLGRRWIGIEAFDYELAAERMRKLEEK